MLHDCYNKCKFIFMCYFSLYKITWNNYLNDYIINIKVIWFIIFKLVKYKLYISIAHYKLMYTNL